jgi:hypothetical protein
MDMCIMISDRRLLQMVKEKVVRMPCSIVRGMVRKLVVKTWMFLDIAVGEWARTHMMVSAEPMAAGFASEVATFIANTAALQGKKYDGHGEMVL